MASANNTRSRNALISRAVLFCLIWWVLTDGAVASWWVGVPAVVVALIVSKVMLPPTSFIWVKFFSFIPFFLVRSLLGGVDVARRAFQPTMPIAPALIEYPVRLSPGLPVVLMVNIVNLMPGTLCAAVEQGVLKVHVLDGRTECSAELVEVEQHVANIFGISLQAFEGTH